MRILSTFLLLLITVSPLFAQEHSIAEIQGSAEDSPYNNQTVTTRGIVTGAYKDGYFIQDGDVARSGIYIYDPGRDPMPRQGDSVLLTGLVTEYYYWTEIKSLSSFEVLSSGNTVPDPVILMADEVNEDWESCLIKIEEATCSNTNLGYGEWEIEDATGTVVVNDMGVSFSPELNQKYAITGPLSFSYSFFKVEPRTLNDIEILAPVYFTEKPYASDIQKNAISINWSTNTVSSTGVFWGLTPDLEMGELVNTDLVTDHTINITELDPATLLYIQSYSTLEDDTAKSPVTAYITASESSGQINVSFNRTLIDPTFVDSPELFTNSLADTFINYINKAQSTLDLALYDFTNHAAEGSEYDSGIEEAILAAKDRGVTVRLITDADVAATAPGGTAETYPRLEVSHDGIMHHKFIIIDHQSAGNSWVISGSTNPNYNNMVIDFNNLIAIQDQSLAKAYLIEFNEIWGGDGPDPIEENSRSGSNKLDNSPHQFNIGGKSLELYFSPSDMTTSKIVDALNSSNLDISFSVMAFTENLLGDAVIAAKNTSSVIHGVIDYVEYSGSEYDYLKNSGIDVKDFINPDGSSWPDGPTLHHKFAVVDNNSDSPIVITGSHNWTASAESKNDENTLIIHDAELADKYIAEFNRIYGWLNDPPLRPELNDDEYILSNSDSELILDVVTNDSIWDDYSIEITTDPLYGSCLVLETQSLQYTFNYQDDEFDYLVKINRYPQFTDTAHVNIQYASSSKELEVDSEFNIYPNPASDILYLSAETGTPIKKVELVDLAGRLALVIENENRLEAQIDLSHLQAGIYLVRIHLNEGIIQKKLVVE